MQLKALLHISLVLPLAVLGCAAAPRPVAYTTSVDASTAALMPVAMAATRAQGYRVTATSDELGAFVAIKPQAREAMLVQIEHPLPLPTRRTVAFCDSATCQSRFAVTPLGLVGDKVVVDQQTNADAVADARQLLHAIVATARSATR
jgi:hypothetical protein